MSWWRKDVIEFALDQDTLRQVDQQKAWIAAEPANARPYYQLAMLYRLQHRRTDALGLLLHAVSLDVSLAPAHTALAEMYIAADDLASARLHAAKAEALGEPGAAEQLRRYGG